MPLKIKYINTDSSFPSLTYSFLHVAPLTVQDNTLVQSPQIRDRTLHSQEIGPFGEILEEGDLSKRVVLALYEALSSRDVHTVHQLVAPDLEWWFHGPPSHQYLMRLLTGATSPSPEDNFSFDPVSITPVGSTVVLVEGCNHDGSISWVHAWTVSEDGVITQVREYFNTSVTVTRFGKRSISAAIASSASRSGHCPSVWESSLSEGVGKSVPGLVLAI